jgi:drug/metabolite transporter (DMT)-like permease
MTLTAVPATKRSYTGWIIALLSTLCFSMASPLARGVILLGLDPTALLMVRLVLTTVLVLGTMLLTDPSSIRIDRRGLMYCLIGGFANGLGMITYFISLTRLNSSIASMIFSVSPLVVLGLLALRGERFTARNSIRLLLGLAGVYLLIGPGGEVDGWGAVLASVSVFTVPVQLVVIQWYLEKYDTRTVTLYMIVTMTVMALGYWLYGGAPFTDVGWQGWVLVIALAVITTYIARLLLTVAVRHIGGGQFGLLAPVETMMTVIWSYLFLGERLTPLQWAGSLLIIVSASLAIQRLGRAKLKQPIPNPQPDDVPGTPS